MNTTHTIFIFETKNDLIRMNGCKMNFRFNPIDFHGFQGVMNCILKHSRTKKGKRIALV